MKKFVKFCLMVMLVFLPMMVSCTEKKEEATDTLAVPENFVINGTVITFDSVDNATKYRVEITNTATNAVIKRFVESGDDLNDLNIPEGSYSIKLQAMNNKAESELSAPVSYKQKDLYMVKELSEEQLIDGNYVKWMGRTSFSDTTKENTMYYSASGFEVKVKKDEEALTLDAVLTATNTVTVSKRPYIVLVKDNDFDNTITICVTSKESTIHLIGEGGFSIEDEEVHTIALYKRTESIDSHIALKSLSTNGKFIEGVTYKERKIEVIAASSSTGYGNLGSSSQTKETANSDALNAFAFLTARDLNAEINIVSASGWGIYASRWTSPVTINMHDQYKYVDVFSDELWDSSKYTPDVIVTNFGTNDWSYIALATGAEQTKRMEAFISTYVDFLNNLHRTYPNAKIVVLYGLMLETNIYESTVEIYNRAKTTISDLEILKVTGDAKGCNSHPSKASHRAIANDLTAKIKEMMNW